MKRPEGGENENSESAYTPNRAVISPFKKKKKKGSSPFFQFLSAIVGLEKKSGKKGETHSEPLSTPKKTGKKTQAPAECVDVLLVTRAGRPSGEAFVVLGGGPAALLSAVARDKRYLGRRYIEVFAARRAEYYRAVSAEVAREDSEAAAGAAASAAAYAAAVVSAVAAVPTAQQPPATATAFVIPTGTEVCPRLFNPQPKTAPLAVNPRV